MFVVVWLVQASVTVMVKVRLDCTLVPPSTCVTLVETTAQSSLAPTWAKMEASVGMTAGLAPRDPPGGNAVNTGGSLSVVQV